MSSSSGAAAARGMLGNGRLPWLAAQLRRQQLSGMLGGSQPCHRAFASDSSDPDSKPSLKEMIFGKKVDQPEAVKEAVAAAAAAAGAEASADGAVNSALVPSGTLQHRKLFLVELTRKPLFPGIYTAVSVHNERLIKEIKDTRKAGGQAYVGAFLRRPDPDRPPGTLGGEDAAEAATDPVSAALAEEARKLDPTAHLYDIGTFAQVHTILTGDTADSAQLLLLGHRRIKRTATMSTDPLKVQIENLRDARYTNDDHLKATSMELVNTMRDLLQLNPLYGEQFRTLLSLTGSIDLQDMSRLVDAAASLTSADDATLQAILEQLVVPDRTTAVLQLLKKEVELCKLQADIREQVETKIVKEQRRMLLMEQLKSIKKDLGLEKDDKSALVQKFQQRWEPKAATAPADVGRVVQDEIDKLGSLEPVSPEFNVTRNYLEWLTSLPWGACSVEKFDIDHAKKVLDDDHHGLDDVKERILEFIAVSRLRGSVQGKILCLVGPPGVGKTSIGRSIANTLNRKYFRFSVGGLYDVAEIKGHRRTYVGAMPGKMVQCLKSTGASNPLVLIDEIDKLGRGHAGDPASALLELLDPEQNSTFLDHYLDVPVDLSKVLFVCTANVIDTIPGPLLDRMEVIRLSGYATDEKRAIARRYLEPTAAREAGIPEGSVTLGDAVMESLIGDYCREAGVRNLKKQLEKVYRKVALQLVKNGAQGPPPPEPVAPAAAAAASAPPAAAAPVATSSGEGAASSPTEAEPSATSSSSTTTTSSDPSSSSSPSPTAPGSTDSTPSSSSSSSSSSGSTAEGGAEALTNPAPAAVGPSGSTYSGEPIRVDESNLKDYLGQPPFAKDRFYDVTPPGVVMGLAWTSMGGATLYVEAAKVWEGEARGSLTTTGQLGDVFKESASIAHTYARAYLASRDPANRYFSNSAVHVHVPAGATPKDGPSAGCTLVTALVSLALGAPVRPDLAMTGEVTLTGRVLPIGGVKEKILAARRSGVKTVLFPEANRRDYDELGPELRNGDPAPHFVSTYDEVFKLAFQYDGAPPLPPLTPAPATPAAAEASPAAPAAAVATAAAGNAVPVAESLASMLDSVERRLMLKLSDMARVR